MPDVETLAEAFPDVDLTTLGKIHEMLDNPTRGNVAEVLEAAARKGKVPEGNYVARTRGAVEPELHPEFRDELEKEGLDPKKAEEGMKAEREVQAERWREESAAVARNGSFGELIGHWRKLNNRINQVLQSPMRENIPEEMSAASKMISKEVESRIDHAAMQGRENRLVEMREELHDVPIEDARDALLDKVRSWLILMDNSGSEFEDARQWVRELDDPGDVARRLKRLRTDQKFDVTAEQVGEIVDETRAEFGLTA